MKPLKQKVSVTLDPEVIEKLKLLCEEHDRTLSAYINIVLKEHVKKASAE